MHWSDSVRVPAKGRRAVVETDSDSQVHESPLSEQGVRREGH